MRILYIFPHPDDESFGPAMAMSQQRRAGHEVYLLTLTRGGATKMREALGYSVEEMGEVRYQEMQAVARVLDLSGMTVLDLPDSGLEELDPRGIEEAVRGHIETIRPDIVVTYPVHGISGFHDHLVTHAVVKRVYVSLKEGGADYLKRLAFYTVDEAFAAAHGREHRLNFSRDRSIDCILRYDEEDVLALQRALDCYVTYQEMIERTGIRESAGRTGAFEIFGEACDPPLDDLCRLTTGPRPPPRD